MVYTSNYKNIDYKDFKDKMISISGDRGRDAGFEGECYPTLAPKKDFWRIWKDNLKRGCDNEENNKYYIREYYDQVLANLNIDEEYNKLEDKILLCYENENDFCHRQIVGAWFELILGVIVSEVKQDGYKLLDVTNRDWVKNYLEEVIKDRTDMMGFSSLRARHLFLKGERIEREARNNYEIEIGKYYKELSSDIEEEYKIESKIKSKRVDN